ncbi:uncharacterized protein LOC106071561 isoform X2 [Biomphalaria glabrata]|uniref:Uncharacterized protein LOC106071561 isoform X2 n=1 Tax=Biomphalaria glabrata TaxID=6526 RepID=A0A9W3ACK0_BIOGL|nr:uncharacterized protein LOC106071561 isoform X2 [Biomphalaria glabrata]
MWWILLIAIGLVQCQDFCNIKNYTPQCQYACRCNGSCDSIGNCLGSSCSDGWFGTACQYSDVTNNAMILPKSAETLRANSSRQDCGQRVGPHFVILTWNLALPFTWLRIKIINKTTFKNISLSLNDALCQRTKIFSTDDTTLDLYCDNNVSMTTLKLEGDSVGNICTIFVSGGRNFALFQKTEQSSTHESHNYDSQFAVDGMVRFHCIFYGCSHTNQRDLCPSWTVRFDQDYYIYKCVIYNRNAERQRLKGFVLEMLDQRNSTLFRYEDSEPTKLVYTVLNLNGGSVAAINVSQKNWYGPDLVPYVSINEFEAYGECLPGFWGLSCKERCPTSCSSSCHAEHGKCNTICIGYADPPLCSIECDSTKWGPNCSNNCSASCYNSSCDKLTGMCLFGCLGYQDFPYCTTECNETSYGLNCSNTCPSNCINGTCDSITGKCSGCMPGFKGVFCNIACDATFFGSTCKERCSTQCSQNACDSKTGKCFTCLPGYKGDFCNIICEFTHYGQNCSSTCSPSCIDQLCDRHDGHCLSCNKTMYGKQCKEKCPMYCLNDSCEMFSGKCMACKPDYVGDFCDKSPNAQDISVAVGVGVGLGAAVVLLIVLVVVVVYKRRVRQRKQETVDGVDNVAKLQEEDHYDTVQPHEIYDTDSLHDHYDSVPNELNDIEKANERHYEIQSSQQTYDQLSFDIDDTGKVHYEKVSSPKQNENISRLKQYENVSIEDK